MDHVIVASNTGPDLDVLLTPFFGSPSELANFEEVTADEVPAPFHELLVHNRHMTVTLEAFYGCPVQLQLLARRMNDTHYVRNSLLRRSTDGKLVQFGVARLAYTFLPAAVRQEIEDARKPMGRILISHNVLRRVELSGLWRLQPKRQLAEIFGSDVSQPTFGRTALIYCAGEPAVEVLEVMPPGLGSQRSDD